ncbi:MAG: hypothetical protein GX758_04255 [Tenericutes bacterium]|nr:hypothetical protein [Mycoplasmatota bacterium]
MKNKGIFIITLILFVVTLSCGVVGYYENKKSNNGKNGDDITEEKITYKYYLEDIEQEEMPLNNKSVNDEGIETVETLYIFSRFVCTNDVTGDFNIDTWEFVPSEEKASVCSLYFVNSQYEVTLTVTNGEASADNLKFIEREKNGSFVIIPEIGYEFESSTCSNEKQTEWNPVTNTLSINTIMSDVACKVVFKIKTLKMDVTVTNGDGNATETAEYGQSVEAIVTPKTGYELESVNCTNNQKAVLENGKLTIEKLTENTACTVKFKKTVVAFTLKVSFPTQLDTIGGSTTQKINSGSTGTFTIKSNTPGISVGNISCEDSVTPSKIEENTDGSVKYTFLNITKNITCHVTAKTD